LLGSDLNAHRDAGEFVAYYRLYLLGEPGGRFVGFEEIEAADDVEAERHATAHQGPQALELWCGKRKVRVFPAGEPSGPSDR
jgi:hypothetical protein